MILNQRRLAPPGWEPPHRRQRDRRLRQPRKPSGVLRDLCAACGRLLGGPAPSRRQPNQHSLGSRRMTKPTRVLILGGGFAGTTVALHLERLLRRDPLAEITLVDSENFFTFTPLLPEVPSGSIQPKHSVFPLRALLKRTAVQRAEVRSIDLERRMIVAAHCHACGNYTLPFDHLVLAMGSMPNYFRLPGVVQHALSIKSLADAAALHAHVIDKLEHAELQSDPAARRELLTFVLAGGGFAGVETIAELNDF